MARRLEVQSDVDHNIWMRATLDGVTPEGKVFIRYDQEPLVRRHVDLTQLCYRWLYGENPVSEAVTDGPAGPGVIAARAVTPCAVAGRVLGALTRLSV